jgi:hypothetical protein
VLSASGGEFCTVVYQLLRPDGLLVGYVVGDGAFDVDFFDDYNRHQHAYHYHLSDNHYDKVLYLYQHGKHSVSHGHQQRGVPDAAHEETPGE